MAEVGAVFLTIFLVLLALPTVYCLFWWVFRQMVARPFLQGKQPDIVHGCLCSWPPQACWPLFTTEPQDDKVREKWHHKRMVFVVVWFLFLFWFTGLSFAQMLTSNTTGSPNWFAVQAYVITGALITIPWACCLVDVATAAAFAYCHFTEKPLPNQRKNWEIERWSAVNVLVLIFTLVGCSTGYSWGADGPITKVIEVPLARLPACLDGVTVFMVTDVHVGPGVGQAFVEEVARVSDSLKPDIIVHTGDGGDGAPSKIGSFTAALANVQTNKRFFVTGNHEYTHGATGRDWEEWWESKGYNVLHNQAKVLGANDFPGRSCGPADSLSFVGIPDDRAASNGPNMTAAVSTVPQGGEWILLSHQPKWFPEATEKGVGLQLSGHIHAGQCFPLHPIIYMTSRGLFSGLIKEDNSYIFVSNGNANWGPRVRLFSTPHHTLLKLRHAATFTAEGKVADTSFTYETRMAIVGLVIGPMWLLGLLAVFVAERWNGGAAAFWKKPSLLLQQEDEEEEKGGQDEVLQGVDHGADTVMTDADADLDVDAAPTSIMGGYSKVHAKSECDVEMQALSAVSGDTGDVEQTAML